MIKTESELAIKLHSILDILLTVAAFIWAYFIKKYFLPESFRGLTESPSYYIVLLMIIIIWFILFKLFGLYTSYLKISFAKIFSDMVKAVSVGMILMVLLMFVFKLDDVSRLLMGFFFLLNIGVLTFSKRIIYNRYVKKPISEYKLHNVLIVGSKERARDVIRAIGTNKHPGFRAKNYPDTEVETTGFPRYKIMGCIDLDEKEIGKKVINDFIVIDTIKNLDKILLENPIDELFIAMPLNLISRVEDHVAFAGKIGIPVRVIPDWQIKDLIVNPAISFFKLEIFSGLATIVLSAVAPDREEFLIKHGIDYMVAAIGLILQLPLFILVFFAIKISSQGPVFYKQERCGLNGRKFMVYKFRSMVAGAEAQQKGLEEFNETEGPVFKIKKDPRIVPYVGTFLRRTFIDEIPQLINVLKGEMSLIGPRPPIPAEVEKYEIWQRRRLSMKPGITCLWQISANRHDMSFDEWMNLDLNYIDNWSLILDVKIFFSTLKLMLLGTGR
ncbi:MAG TPA: sugar transferase [Desulfobacterales bacterium]|nr:sugar transferase [Desulfobacterales bacterium]